MKASRIVSIQALKIVNLYGIIIFTCETNLECLCSVEELFMDGTFKCCSKFFTQLYTVHGYRNGNYVPLVFILLPEKTYELYRCAFCNFICLCNEKDLTLVLSVIHVVDFEETVMKLVENTFPSSVIKCREIKM